MKRKIVILLLPLILWACSDEVPMVNLGIDDVYVALGVDGGEVSVDSQWERGVGNRQLYLFG